MEEKPTGAEEKQNTSEVESEPSHFTTPPRWKEKLKLHKWRILGGILGVLVFAGAVFGAYKLGTRQAQPIPTPAPTLVVTPTPDPTADWQTYKSEILSFEIKHPPYYAPTESISEKNQGTASFYVDEICNQNYPSFYVNYNNRVLIQEELVSSEPIVVNSIQTNLDINELPNDDHCIMIGKAKVGDRLRASVFFSVEGNEWQIGAIVRKNYLEADLNTFNLMLSTFRFLEEDEAESFESRKASLLSTVNAYLKALIVDKDWGKAKNYLTSAAYDFYKDVDGPTQYVIYEILNEFHSTEEEISFYNQQEPIFDVKFYKQNDPIGTRVSIKFLQEDGQWKTDAWFMKEY